MHHPPGSAGSLMLTGLIPDGITGKDGEKAHPGVPVHHEPDIFMLGSLLKLSILIIQRTLLLSR